MNDYRTCPEKNDCLTLSSDSLSEYSRAAATPNISVKIKNPESIPDLILLNSMLIHGILSRRRVGSAEGRATERA